MFGAPKMERLSDPGRALALGDVLLHWPRDRQPLQADFVLKVAAAEEDGGLDLALIDAQGSLLSSVKLGGKPGGWWLDETLSHPAVQGLERQMRRLARLRAQPAGGGKSRAARWALALSIAAFGLSALALGGTGYLWIKMQALGAAAKFAAEPVVMQAAPAPSAASALAAVAADELGLEQMSILQEVVARSGFSLNTQGALVVMFADPLCPACRQFEQWMQEDGYKTFAPLVVPVAFKDGARELAATVLCAKGNDEQAKAWRLANQGALTPKPCEEGLRRVDANNAAFAAMGLSATPSFVSVNGKKLSGARPLKEMARWAEQNTPPNPAKALAAQ